MLIAKRTLVTALYCMRIRISEIGRVRKSQGVKETAAEVVKALNGRISGITQWQTFVEKLDPLSIELEYSDDTVGLDQAVNAGEPSLLAEHSVLSWFSCVQFASQRKMFPTTACAKCANT